MPWFSRVGAEDLTAIPRHAVGPVLLKLDAICGDSAVRQSESFTANLPHGMRVAIPHDGPFGREWYFFDYQIAREQYLLVINVSGPFRRIPAP